MILLAQTEAPTPLPQTATPRFTSSAAPRPGQRSDAVGVIIVRHQLVGAEIYYLVTRLTQLGGQFLFQLKPAVIGGNSHTHQLLF